LKGKLINELLDLRPKRQSRVAKMIFGGTDGGEVPTLLRQRRRIERSFLSKTEYKVAFEWPSLYMESSTRGKAW
jgi:hypothetical protein